MQEVDEFLGTSVLILFGCPPVHVPASLPEPEWVGYSTLPSPPQVPLFEGCRELGSHYGKKGSMNCPFRCRRRRNRLHSLCLTASCIFFYISSDIEARPRCPFASIIGYKLKELRCFQDGLKIQGIGLRLCVYPPIPNGTLEGWALQQGWVCSNENLKMFNTSLWY